MNLETRLAATLDRPGGDPRRRCLALMHAATCSGHFDALEALHVLAPGRSVHPHELEEMALQVVAYGGFPRAIEGLERLRRHLGGLDPTREQPAGEEPPDGREVFDRVYGDRADAVLRHLDELAPAFSRWILRNAYGHILARPGLPLAERELLAVAALALMGLPRPLESHMRGALRNGSTIADVEDILHTVAVLADQAARIVIDRALERLLRKDRQA